VGSTSGTAGGTTGIAKVYKEYGFRYEHPSERIS
jgi:hypothetical protein